MAISPFLALPILLWDETTVWKPIKCIAQSPLPAGFQLDLPISLAGKYKLLDWEKDFFFSSFWVCFLILVIKSFDSGRSSSPHSDRSHRHIWLDRVSSNLNSTGTLHACKATVSGLQTASVPYNHQRQSTDLQAHITSLAVSSSSLGAIDFPASATHYGNSPSAFLSLGPFNRSIDISI